jgi:two-component system, chemotaxis family, protein-glutamate methylesterase/glutaminase
MPGAIAQAGLADEILPLDRIPEAITRHLAGVSPARPIAALSGGAR